MLNRLSTTNENRQENYENSHLQGIDIFKYSAGQNNEVARRYRNTNNKR